MQKNTVKNMAGKPGSLIILVRSWRSYTSMPAKTVSRPPHPTAVYARTGKGVLSFKNGTAKVSGELKELFACIDGKASVADLGAQTEMQAEELNDALEALEKKGYIKVFKEGVEQAAPDFTEAPDLDFTSPGSLLEISVREAAKAKANAEEHSRDNAAQLPEEPVQAPREAAEGEPQAGSEAVSQRAALEAQIKELEAETGAMRRARDDAIKALGQAKTLAAEEHRRAEELALKLAEAKARNPGAAVATGPMQEALTQAQETVAHLEVQLATEHETREQTVQALREAQSEAEAGRNAAEMRLKESQIALQAAEKVDRQNRERLKQLETQIETGRRARAEAEAGLATAATAREALQAELAAAATAREAVLAELAEAKIEGERTAAALKQHAERIAKLESEIDTERRARADAEANANAEREGREKAKQALLEVRKVIGAWKDE